MKTSVRIISVFLVVIMLFTAVFVVDASAFPDDCYAIEAGISIKNNVGQETKKDDKSVLLKKVKKKTKKKISKVFYADFDGDGLKELFAVAGPYAEFEDQPELWFASTVQTKKLSLRAWIVSACRAKVSSKQSLFIAEESAGGSSSGSICYYVKNGKAVKIKEQLSELKQIKSKDFTVVDNAFDAVRSDGILTGHTYKIYYLKWKGTKFTEYKGKRIEKSDVKKYKNGSSILTKIKQSGYTVDKIYKRSNGVININVHRKTNSETIYENVNLKISDGALKVIKTGFGGNNIVEKSSYGGIYKASIL